MNNRVLIFVVAAAISAGFVLQVLTMDKPIALAAFASGLALTLLLLLIFIHAVDAIVAAIHDIGRSDNPPSGPSGP